MAAYVCKTCGKSFKQKYHLNRHSKFHCKIFSCSLCNGSFSCVTIKTHMLTHTKEKSHSCKICGKVFALKINCEKHLVVHTGERNFKCDICGKSYTENGTLTKHKKSVHSSTKAFKCKICKAEFKWKESMDRHTKTVHSAKREMFKCDSCNKQFCRKASVQHHYNTVHLNVFPYKCQICGKNFGAQQYFTQHLKTHQAGWQLYKGEECPHCKMLIKGRGHLKNHIQTIHLKNRHYRCSLCGASFTSSSGLISHRAKHLRK